MRKNKRETKRERWRRCASVVIEPSTGISFSVEKSRRSMYELGSDGWIFDCMAAKQENGKDLCIDKQINDFLSFDSSVHVMLGGIKLTF